MIPTEDLKCEIIYQGTGTTKSPGGQHAGSPPTDVRITHIPTGIMVQCGYEQSQHRNRQICIEMLESALTSKHLRWL